MFPSDFLMLFAYFQVVMKIIHSDKTCNNGESFIDIYTVTTTWRFSWAAGPMVQCHISMTCLHHTELRHLQVILHILYALSVVKGSYQHNNQSKAISIKTNNSTWHKTHTNKISLLKMFRILSSSTGVLDKRRGVNTWLYDEWKFTFFPPTTIRWHLSSAYLFLYWFSVCNITVTLIKACYCCILSGRSKHSQEELTKQWK